jgi:Pregnancy-associated plasma protein-A
MLINRFLRSPPCFAVSFTRFLLVKPQTLVHETGHWLGLAHSFQGGCAFPGDGISDTAPQATASDGCDMELDTCPGDNLFDPVTNYMDYSSDGCRSNFTAEQRRVMVAAWFRYRSPPPPTPTPILQPSAPGTPSMVSPVPSPITQTNSSSVKPLTANATMESSFRFCGSSLPSTREDEVRASLSMVDDFYREADARDGWKRRLQGGPITVDVNFVVVSDSTGLGNVTQKMVDDQMTVLNAAYSPDFRFRLSNLQRVSNDTLFVVLARNPYERPSIRENDLKIRYRSGGPETLNVYSLLPVILNATDEDDLIPVSGFSSFPYPILSEDELDGVVFLFDTMPGGQDAGYDEGDVSARIQLLFPLFLSATV